MNAFQKGMAQLSGPHFISALHFAEATEAGGHFPAHACHYVPWVSELKSRIVQCFKAQIEEIGNNYTYANEPVVNEATTVQIKSWLTSFWM